MEDPPEEPPGLVNTKALCSLLARGNHLSTASWRSWRCESITEANQEDSPGDLDQAQSTSPLECRWRPPP